MNAHRNDVLHWAPEAVEDKPWTACGRNIDGPCDRHNAEGYPCRHGVAWTRSTDLDAYRGRPMEPKWPPPCPVCTDAIGLLRKSQLDCLKTDDVTGNKVLG